MRDFNKYVEFKTKQMESKGMKFDTSGLAPKFIPYFESGQRIIVRTHFNWVVRGYVGVTTGWKPSFILLSKSNSISSPVLLDNRYEIIGTVNKYLHGRRT